MTQLAAQAGQAAVVRQACRGRPEAAPEQAPEHQHEQQNAQATMDIRPGLVPTAVVIQTDHPVAQREQDKHRQRHQPVHDDADQTVAGG